MDGGIVFLKESTPSEWKCSQYIDYKLEQLCIDPQYKRHVCENRNVWMLLQVEP